MKDDQPHLQTSLQSIEQRLAILESRTKELLKVSQLGIFPLLRRVIRPRVWTYHQYASRRLKVDPAYALETAPEAPPRIAIVTPSLNQAHFIRATIDSVLTQNYPNLAYRVEDGGSADNTQAILESYGDKIAWQSESDSGQANAINRGFQHVDGEIMAYLNSDDTLLPGTLAYVARAFRDNPDVDVVYGHRIYIDADGFEIGRCVLPPHDPDTLKWADYIPQETMFWRRKVWDAVGSFDESFDYALDWDFLLRVQAAGFRFKRLPRFLSCFRAHEAQKTTSLQHVGDREMHLLRIRYLREPQGTYEIRQGIKGYLVRQKFCEVMYRLRLFRY
jgi:glycosyltransferase involved in cell wall biosynthesis